MGYEKDIEKDAISFIEEHEEEIKEAIINGNDLDDEDSLTDSIREQEYYFTLGDAVVVIETSENTEEDKGLWEDLQPEEALVRKAQYTATNDLWASVREIYDELKEEYNDKVNEEQHDEDAEEWEKKVMDSVFKGWKDEQEVTSLKKGSDEEKRALKEWLAVNEHIGMRGGYPLGSSYIDARCGAGYEDKSEQADYIDLDHLTSKLVPHLRGKYRADIVKYFNKTFKGKVKRR